MENISVKASTNFARISIKTLAMTNQSGKTRQTSTVPLAGQRTQSHSFCLHVETYFVLKQTEDILSNSRQCQTVSPHCLLLSLETQDVSSKACQFRSWPESTGWSLTVSGCETRCALFVDIYADFYGLFWGLHVRARQRFLYVPATTVENMRVAAPDGFSTSRKSAPACKPYKLEQF
eukprot:2859375-Amphidinium_carterae.1